MSLIRPRLTDYYNIAIAQEDADFAIPFLDEDIPFCLDPFLLWKSPSMQDQSLHSILINSFNYLGYSFNLGDKKNAIETLIAASECEEVGLGFSGTRQGHRIGEGVALDILTLFTKIPQIQKNGFSHFEEIQLFVDQISKDRISDIACNYIKSWLIDYTISQCTKLTIPLSDVVIRSIYDVNKKKFVDEKVKLPINPQNNKPVLLVPKRWLRKAPWISFDAYKDYCIKDVFKDADFPDRIEILNFNRKNYDIVQVYIQQREREQKDCRNDPLFNSIPVLSAKRKFSIIKKLPTGKTENADKEYEEHACQLLSSMLYPQLDFAAEQVRTDSGSQIRDLLFYNTRSYPFLSDIYKEYDSRQLVFELKNVKEIERNHINQLNRYLANEFGRFGIFVTRNPLSSAMFRSTVDLWSGHRRCIIVLDDADMDMMVNVYESRQRLPIEVLNRKYVEFRRACPV